MLKNILFIIETLKAGGKERRLFELLKIIHKDKNVRCTIILLFDNIHFSDIYKYDIKVYKLMSPIKNIRIFSEINEIIKHEKPNIIHSFSSLGSLLILPFLFRYKIKFVNSMIANSPKNFFYDFKNFCRGVITFPFSSIITTNSYAAIRTFKMPKSKTMVIHNGFNFLRTKGLKKLSDIKKLLNIKKFYVIGMVASFTEKKDYSTYLKAASIILQERDDVQFYCIGDGPNREKYEKMYKSYSTDMICFTGAISNVEQYVNIFDIGVLTSFGEGFPNSVMEYMAFKKPVIVTKGGGINELALHNKTAFIIDMQDHEQLVEKINILLGDANIRKNFGIEGHRRLKDKFSIDQMVNKTMEIYNNLLS